MGKLCQYCGKREAKIHFTELRDGKKTEMHICEQCAQEKNMALAFPAVLSQLVKGGPAALRETEAVPAACPGCGLAYAEFKAKGRLGCPQDYAVFRAALEPLLERIHRAKRHVGKTPRHGAGNAERQREIVQLRRQLLQAVDAEAYEDAARLRDVLRQKEGRA